MALVPGLLLSAKVRLLSVLYISYLFSCFIPLALGPKRAFEGLSIIYL